LRTAVIGFGRVGSGYAEDQAMARHYQYATHAQVLAAHPEYEWLAVIDPAPAARQDAISNWKVPHTAASFSEIGALANDIEVAVLATPPETRLDLLDQLPALRAVLVEKPLGRTLADGAAFARYCRERGILVQVNLWRRADETLRRLADGGLQQMIGSTGCGFGVYGNGLLNNGLHMVDLVRMLLGEVTSVTALAPDRAWAGSPIADDFNVSFALELDAGAVITLSPLPFANYRENGLDLWGERGRLGMYNEGLTIAYFQRRDNRAMTGEREVAADMPAYLESTVGTAFYHMYSNLAAALTGDAQLWSPAQSALRSSAVVEAIRQSTAERRLVTIDQGAAATAALPAR
jgi:predicted dehydrogenase